MSADLQFTDLAPEELTTFVANVQAATNALPLDKRDNGVTMDLLRPFYPGVNWGQLGHWLNQAKVAGLVASKQRVPPGGKVAFEYFKAVE